jgi:hypothetical protein
LENSGNRPKDKQPSDIEILLAHLIDLLLPKNLNLQEMAGNLCRGLMAHNTRTPPRAGRRRF